MTGIRRTFSALSVRNYRLYALSQIVSLSGTWMQVVAQGVLVLRLTGKGTDLGAVTALQFAPVLLFAPWGGLIADRVNKRRLLFLTQSLSGLSALALAVVVATGSVELWMVYVLAVVLGLVTCVDNPVRQTFVYELVGPDRLTNAVSLNSVMVNAARVVGPAIAGVLIGTIGIAACFFYNAASFLAVLAALALLRTGDLHEVPATPRAKGQLVDGLRYVRRTPELLVPLLLIGVVGMLAWEFQVTFPLLAEYTFGGGASLYGAMSAFMGVGAVVGGLWAANQAASKPSALVTAVALFGASIVAVAAAPTTAIALVLIVPMGAAGIVVVALSNTLLLATTEASMRGRVMSLWTVAIIGTSPIGGLFVGWIGDTAGPRYALGIGGVAALVAAAAAYPRMVARPRRLVARRLVAPELTAID